MSLENLPARFGSSLRLISLLIICATGLTLATATLAEKSRKGISRSRRISAGSRRISGDDRINRRTPKKPNAFDKTSSGYNFQDPVTGITVGVPSAGEVGIQRTTAQVMADQEFAPVSQRPLKPEHPIPGRDDRAHDPNARDGSAWPDEQNAQTAKDSLGLNAVDPVTPAAPQTLGVNVNTVTGPIETGAFPPDTMGAVGPTQFFVFLNGRLRTFNKTTGATDGVVDIDPDVFFASVMTPVSGGTLNINFTSDPQIRFDRLTGRWIMIIIDVPSKNAIGDTANRILVAVSDAASAGVVSLSTVWTYYFVQQDTVGGIPSTGEFLDYPSLGVDANALYIGGDMFGAVSGAFINTTAFVIRKSSILSGGPVVATAFRNLIGADGMLDPRGVDNFDPAATEGYFIGVSFAAFSRLNLRRIGTPGSTPTISADIPFTTPLTTTTAISVNHFGNTGGTGGRVDGLDDRLYAAHIRNGRLWTAHSFTTLNSGVASTNAANRRMSVRWYEINVPPTTGTPTFIQSGTVFDNVNITQATARQYWIPSVMVSGQGHAALGYSTAGTPFRIDAATNGRLVGNTLGTTGAVNIYTASATSYNPPGDPGPTRRWGDYSFTSLDPKDDMTMWTIQEYCSSTNSYGARLVKLIAPPPPPTNSANPSAINLNNASRNIVVTGTAPAGQGYYDPGANPPAPHPPFTHITASGAGIIVNSITYNTPTQVTINVSTVGSTPGSKTVTITNPDGQTTTVQILVGPTAAPVTLIGHVQTSDGSPLAGVTVQLDGSQSATAVSDSNGDYHFLNLQTDGFYSITPAMANYRFSPSSRSFSVLGNMTASVFTADRDASIRQNAIDSTEYFVRQQYVDFLGREPDEAGFGFWSNEIAQCNGDASCTQKRRVNVSAAFFMSIEFQTTGGLVDGLYRASFDRAPQYAEFMPDAALIARNVVVGRDGWEQQLSTNRQAFLDAFVQRAAFKSAYGGLNNNQFVDTLLTNTRIIWSQGERNALVNGLASGSVTRAGVLGQVAGDQRFVQAKFNKTFVMMEYFGYLRRDPDADGYAYWLNKLNQFNGNFEQAEMVKAFIVSGEYRVRFGF